MKEQKRHSLVLQKHHILLIRNLLANYEDPYEAAYFLQLKLSSSGYTRTIDQGFALRTALETALEAVRHNQYRRIPDGQPDLICMTCSKECLPIHHEEIKKP